MQCIYTHVYSLCGRTNADKIRLNFENYTKDVYDFSYVSTAIIRCFNFVIFISFDKVLRFQVIRN